MRCLWAHYSKGAVHCSANEREEIEDFVARILVIIFAAAYGPLVAFLWPGVKFNASNANKQNASGWFHSLLSKLADG